MTPDDLAVLADLSRFKRMYPGMYRRFYEFVRSNGRSLAREYLVDVQNMLAEQGGSLPGYVVREFEDYLKCGRLEPAGSIAFREREIDKNESASRSFTDDKG